MTGTVANQDNLFDCAGRLIDFANKIKNYRLSKPNLTPSELSDLGIYEKQFREQATEIAIDVAEDILARLQNEIKKIKESTDKVKQALKALKGIQEIIQGFTEVLQLVNSVIQVIPKPL